MTRSEEKDMAELRMSEAQLEERREKLATLGIIGHVAQMRPIASDTDYRWPVAVDDLPPAQEAKAEDVVLAAPEPEKKSRLSVAKLLARYQERTKETVEQIETVKKSIIIQTALVSELEQRADFWREAISEIERD